MADLFEYLSEKYQPESIAEVNRRLLELSSLFEISQLLNESLELNRVLNNILFIPMGRLLISRGVVLLKIDSEYKTVMAKGIPNTLRDFSISETDLPDDWATLQKAVSLHIEEENSPFNRFAREAGLNICIPFVSNNRLLGIMLFSKKMNRVDFKDEEIEFLTSLANLAATTIENALQLEEIKQINRRLDEKIQELNTLFDINRGLSATLNFDEILNLLGLTLRGQMQLTRYAILLKNADSLTVYENRGIALEKVNEICSHLQNIPTPSRAVPVRELNHKHFLQACADNQLSVLVPMEHQDVVLGYILLGKKITGEPYEDTDLEFLTTLVSQAVISLENARLFKETLEKQRLEEELNVARTIQKNLLPSSIPEIEGYEIVGMNHSSKQVGGDYYDVIRIDENHVALAIGDVSGKGVPASLLMANLQAALRVIIASQPDLADVVGQLNNLIYSNTGMDKFITFFLGVLDTSGHTLTYVNAGHNIPFLISDDGTIRMLDKGGLILGIMPDYQYQTETILLKKGDLLLCYTDGVNEAVNEADEEFGEPALRELLLNHRHKPIGQILDIIWKAIQQFSAGMPQADDVTMLGLRKVL